MKTTLPVGSIIKMRQRGRDELWKLVPSNTPGQLAYTGVGEHLKKGTIIHQVTWGKNDTLNVKRTYELTEDCDWVPFNTPTPDTTEAEYRAQEQVATSMASMFGAFGAFGSQIWMRTIVVDGHTVMITADAGSSVVGVGFSWSWMADTRGPDGFFHPIAPTLAEVQSWSFADVVTYARKVLDAYHQQTNLLATNHKQIGVAVRCGICHPVYHNVEKPKSGRTIKS